MSLGMKIKEKMIREFTPSQEDITEVGEKLDEIKKVIIDMQDLIFEEENSRYIQARKDLTESIINIGYIKQALGLVGRH
jgi:predicted nucleic-acid-binding protein